MKDVIEGSVPVQGRGTVDGLCWFFRARGARWTLNVGPQHQWPPGEAWREPLKGYVADADAVFSAHGRWGEDYEAGWMDDWVATGIVYAALCTFRNGFDGWEAPHDLGRGFQGYAFKGSTT